MKDKRINRLLLLLRKLEKNIFLCLGRALVIINFVISEAICIIQNYIFICYKLQLPSFSPNISPNRMFFCIHKLILITISSLALIYLLFQQQTFLPAPIGLNFCSHSLIITSLWLETTYC